MLEKSAPYKFQLDQCVSFDTWSDGDDKYFGTKDSKGLKHGFCRMITEYGDIFETQYAHDKKHGYERSFYSDGYFERIYE